MLAALLVAGLLAAQIPPPQRDTAPAAAATAVIRGRVVAAATKQPLHRVRVTVGPGDPNAPSAVTGMNGVFELKVPAGAYRLTAVRAGYLTLQHGQRRPREAGQTLEVKAGDVVERIDFAMYRGAVLAGRVLDETGEPAPGARVEAIEQRYIRGRRIAVAARIMSANDAGEYRLSNLDPGVYTIRASTSDVWDADDGSGTLTHAVTWYPGVTAGDRVESLTLAIGQEQAGLDLQLIPGRAARITGVLLDAAGQPLANHMIHRSVITRGIGGALQYSGPGGDTRTDAAGAFAFTRLSPGEYLILTGNDAARSAENVVLGDGESRHVIMTPRRETAVKGTVVTDDGLRPAFAGSRLRVVPIPIEADRALQRWGEGQPQSLDSTGTFQLTGLDGGYLFRLTGLPAGWTLTSVTLGGRDITDTPLGVERGSPDVTGLRVVVSQKSAAITGSVTDREGKPSGDASVIVFAENSALWGPGSRYIAAVPLDRAGRFSVALPPGVYRAIARDAIVDGQWEDPEFLQALVKDTVRVELGAGGTETVTLTLDVPR